MQYSTWRDNNGEGALYAAIKALEIIEPGAQPYSLAALFQIASRLGLRCVVELEASTGAGAGTGQELL